jgi:hypothetical protein
VSLMLLLYVMKEKVLVAAMGGSGDRVGAVLTDHPHPFDYAHSVAEPYLKSPAMPSEMLGFRRTSAPTRRGETPRIDGHIRIH